MANQVSDILFVSLEVFEIGSEKASIVLLSGLIGTDGVIDLHLSQKASTFRRVFGFFLLDFVGLFEILLDMILFLFFLFLFEEVVFAHHFVHVSFQSFIFLYHVLFFKIVFLISQPNIY